MTDSYPTPPDDAALGATWASAWSALGRLAPADPQAGSDEFNSAAWAARSRLRAGAGADSDTAQRVHDLVMATQHGLTQETAPASLGPSPDARLLVDIGLSVLGSPAERLERYNQDVRKVHAWVPGFRYQEARAQVLQSFHDRPRPYHGEHAVALLEVQTRIHLAAALTFTLRRRAQ